MLRWLRPTNRGNWTTLVVAVGTIGCSSGVEPDRGMGALIQTDAEVYSLDSIDGMAVRVDIPYVFENRTATPVRIPNCLGSFLLDLARLDEGEWVQAWTRAVFACRSPEIVIDVGETFIDTLRVLGRLPGSDVGPTTDVIGPGETYRIEWFDAYTSSGDRLGLSDRVSNAFVLTGP